MYNCPTIVEAVLVTDTGFGRALEHLRSVADGNGHTKGKLFERLIRSFLKTDRLYTDRFTDVWLWNDYPDRNGRPDFGIDLVAKEPDGSLCAIQCKFYADKRLAKPDIDSFLEGGSRSEFQHMMLVYSGRGYGKKVEEALNGHKCQALNFESLASSSIDWPDLAAGLTEVRQGEPYDLMDHQKQALNDVVAGFNGENRGQMLMACGTGKTLTSLRIAERLAEGKDRFLVLYAVPSISLMHQAIRYWSEQRTVPQAYIGVCSDPSVSHGERTEIPIVEMEIGVSTDERRIASALKRDTGRMTVMFATYHSMGAVMKAQKMANVAFDLVVCDEAHRTTGIEGRSSFTLVHNDENIVARKRLYMTATPKIYKAALRTRASNADNTLYSMDRQSVYGQTLYRLDFSNAIDLKLLSDYKVIVLGVDERYGGKALQNLVNTTTEAGDLNLTDAARMLGYYRVLENPDPDSGMRSLQTSIAYTNRIKDSEAFANTFKNLTLEANLGGSFSCDARHVDGTQNASVRADALQWLRDSPANPNECLILSNARCLSEGVDVPALDSICFLNPKSSPGEIVQAVGRVMRKAPGKEYGYVIIPIGVPPDARSETILDNNRVFDQVWDILRAMRSHDARLDIEANVADLKKELPKRVKIIGVDREGRMRLQEGSDAIPLGELDVPADVLYSRIVEEVGDRRYFVRWAGDVAEVVARLQERVLVVLQDDRAKAQFDAYMTGLREIIHGELADSEGIEMLAQHLVTRRIFNAMFDSDDFARQNPVSAALDGVVDELRSYGLDTELRDIEGFYRSIENRVARLDSHDARQPVISELYGTFFKKAFPEMAARLGIVYTPTEVVDFILLSVDYVLRKSFGRGLTAKNVNIIDPFTGAGTFITRMMSAELGLIRDEDLKRKYCHELFASEKVLLAYYIAAVNCESVYRQRTGTFEQFEGLSLTDTFNLGSIDEHTGDLMAGPKRRIKKQREANIKVVIGNPPWSTGRGSGNEKIPDAHHPEIENRIRETYASKVPHIKQKRSLLNSYIKAIRWASDQIREFGVIGFVTQSSYITKDTMAGVRACLVDEFTDVWCFDLLGGKNMPGHGRNIFEYQGLSEGGTTQWVAITILVKNPNKRGCTVKYAKLREIDYSGEDKRSRVKDLESIAGISDSDWRVINPDKFYNWLKQPGEAAEEFQRHMPIGSDKGKKHKDDKTNEVVFGQYVVGVGTGRDDWSYNSSIKYLATNMKRHTDYYNHADLEDFPISPTQAKKSDFAIERLKRLGKKLKFSKRDIRTSLYRPFFKQYFHYEPIFISRPQSISLCFPSGNSENLVIIVPKGTERKFTVFITDVIPDLHIIDSNQCFPLYAYENGRKKQNITEYALRRFQRTYKDDSITHKAIFYYVYGLLHHSGYRKRYRNVLNNNLPTIPMAPDFWAFSTAGRELAKLHLNYETGRRYQLGKPLKPIPASPRRIAFGKKPNLGSGRQNVLDYKKLIVGDDMIYDNLPDMEYAVDGKTTIQWFENRYAFSTAKESRNPNHPLDGKNGEEVHAIIERLMWVGVESDRIMSELAKLEYEMDETNESTLQTTLT